MEVGSNYLYSSSYYEHFFLMGRMEEAGIANLQNAVLIFPQKHLSARLWTNTTQFTVPAVGKASPSNHKRRS